MSKRGDHIHKRKDGRWEGRYPMGRTTKGTIKYGSVYGKTYREVKEKLSKVSLKLSENRDAATECRMTFEEVLQLWMENNKLRLKGATINKYQNLIETHICPNLGQIPILKMDTTTINQFLGRMLRSGNANTGGQLSSSYVRSMAIVISAAMKYAVNEGLCLPLRTPICKPIPEKKELSVLDIPSQQQLELYLSSQLNPTNVGILIALYTGMRIGEICALAWQDVDFERKIIHVRHTVARVRNNDFYADRATGLIIDAPKTRASLRDIPIPTKLFTAIDRLHKKSSSGFIVSGTNSFLHPRTFETRYHKILEECNIRPINFHGLRHTFATRCVEAGVDIKSLSEILGHGNVSVTLNTYVHSSMEAKRNQLEKLFAISAVSEYECGHKYGSFENLH